MGRRTRLYAIEYPAEAWEFWSVTAPECGGQEEGR